MVAALKVGKDTVFWDRELPGYTIDLIDNFTSVRLKIE